MKKNMLEKNNLNKRITALKQIIKNINEHDSIQIESIQISWTDLSTLCAGNEFILNNMKINMRSVDGTN